jgi:hypothetical protein
VGGKKIFFHILDLTKLNIYIILLSCSSQIGHRKFRLILVQKLLDLSSRGSHPQTTPRWRSNPQTSQMTWLEGWQFKHWTLAGSRLRCNVFLSNRNVKVPSFSVKYVKCLYTCFRIYHTEVTFWNTGSLYHGKETTSRNVSAVHFIAIFCFISGIYEPFGKDVP